MDLQQVNHVAPPVQGTQWSDPKRRLRLLPKGAQIHRRFGQHGRRLLDTPLKRLLGGHRLPERQSERSVLDFADLEERAIELLERGGESRRFHPRRLRPHPHG